MIRAAILEDTPDAPFLLSLPILKALNASMHLSQQTMRFRAIQQVRKMLYSGPIDSPDQWQVQQSNGDECHVFILGYNGITMSWIQNLGPLSLAVLT